MAIEAFPSARASVTNTGVRHLSRAVSGVVSAGRDAYTPATLMDAACTLGLDALYRDLRAHEAEDADCQRAPRVKRADDASAVLVRIDRPDA